MSDPAQPATTNVAAQVDPSPTAPKCTKCGDADTRPVSAVYNSGVSAINTTTRGSGIAIGQGNRMTPMFGSSSTSGVQISNLAVQCAPPPRANEPWHIIATHAVIGIFKGIGAGIVFWIIVQVVLRNHDTTAGIAFLAGVILFLVFGIRKGMRIGADARQIKSDWPRLKAEWDAKWICGRCHNQFIP